MGALKDMSTKQPDSIAFNFNFNFFYELQYFNERKVYFAHDENNECTRGDLVVIKESRKLSKKKAFMVSEIVDKAPKVVDPVTGQIHIQDNRE